MSKRTGWLLVAIVIAALGVGFAFMIDKVSVSASSVVLEDSGLRVNFSAPLQPEAIDRGEIYVTDGSGEKLQPEMTIRRGGQTLEIASLPEGDYTLHISDRALKGGFFRTLAMDRIPFTVQQEIRTLSKKEELEDYFARLAKLMENDSRFGAFLEGEATEEAASAESSGEESGHSVTNTQEAGVDEADIVKTDGSFIYSVEGKAVSIADIRNPSDLKVAAELTFGPDVFPAQLMLSGETLIVFGNRFTPPPAGEVHGIMPQAGMTSIFLYDITDPAAPELLREFGTEGHLNSARLTGGILYFVTNVRPMIWHMEEIGEAELRPSVYDSRNGGEPELLDYDQISILPGTLEGTYSIISAIDISGPGQNELSTKGFLGSSEQLYMTEDTLYLTATAYLPPEQQEENEADIAIWAPDAANTEIFKFALDGTDVGFAASAEVPGRLLNQFSMDEHEGHLRVATTEGGWWGGTEPSANHLFILDGQLETVGALRGLAEGERIYSARFMEDTAYLVTFRETDPLFVIDVSEPAAPQVLGKLKIPGFSNYLHPLGEDHLIGFGSETELKPVEGAEPLVMTGGLKVSLFDISDFSNPIEKDVEIIGGRGTYSPIQYDHKALFIEPERSLYGFPVTIYGERQDRGITLQAEGAAVLRITEQGIERAAMLTEEAESSALDPLDTVQRLLYSGDTLYTVGTDSISSYDLSTFELIDVLIQ
ncbi:beta-propeller domain-containing protein [Indiicoccus explosivorum]|uniref:beta-propeller domain-containing protein n=1 Tax=Indiicoccus explosivorum TaxID=1917864 RepID=UPI000B44A608|nr:beta-propeller domain-containing protein [Indiicoccus explosivorum]